MSNQIIKFMVQKQKLKSERGNLNVGIKDMFMTMEPALFRSTAKSLAALRDTDKPGFDKLLEKFEERKGQKQGIVFVGDIVKKHYLRDKKLNRTLSEMLFRYWESQDCHDGGYFWCMIPKEKLEDESEEVFMARKQEMEDLLMQVELLVLQDCGYYIKGTR